MEEIKLATGGYYKLKPTRQLIAHLRFAVGILLTYFARLSPLLSFSAEDFHCSREIDGRQKE
jgi:hypothetical protein